MSNQKKILIAEENGEMLRNMLSAFRSVNFECIVVQKDGAAVLDEIAEHEPDVVIVEAFMSRLDALAVLQRLDSMKLRKKPCVAVLSNGLNETLEHQMIACGAAYCFIKPLDIASFTERIALLAGCELKDKAAVTKMKAATEADLEEIVSEIMHELGIPAHIKGYQYLRASIMFTVGNPEMMDSVTKILYPAVAKKFAATPSRVERAIRHAIEVAWDRGDIDVLTSYFGYTIQTARGKPTNSEFIAMIADRLRLKLKKTS